MRQTNQARDLSFGADVIEVAAQATAIARDIDGKEYDFSDAGPSLGPMLAKAFVSGRSKNESALSRSGSNAALFNAIRYFGRWAASRGDITIYQAQLQAYRDLMFGTKAASTASTHYRIASWCARELMRLGDIDRFVIPENATARAVQASISNAGASMATAFNGKVEPAGIDDFNESTLALWIKVAWSELSELFERIETGKRWRAEADDPAWVPPEWFGCYRHVHAMTRSEAISLLKTMCVHHLGGKAPHIRKPISSSRASWSRAVKAIGSEFSAWRDETIDQADIDAAIADPSVPIADIAAWAESPSVEIGGCRRDRVKLIVQLLHRRFGGFPSECSLAQDFDRSPDESAFKAVRILRRTSRVEAQTISTAELATYFHPSAAMVGLALSLFSAAHVNPESAMDLDVSSLVDDEQAGIKRLQWRKGRARGRQPAMPFPEGSPTSKTIPRLFERFVAASAELRSSVPETARGKLFLWTSGDTGEQWFKCFGYNSGGSSVWAHTRDYLAGRMDTIKPSPETVEILGPIAQHLDAITPSLIRNTAINIASARLNRDFGAAAAMDGRKSTAVLRDHYLDNAQTHDHLDRQVRGGQAALAAWLKGAPEVLPNDEPVIAATLSVEPSMARRIAKDELNLGNGASLVDDRAVFIDTPINALRVMQWLRRLGDARERMLVDNPGRWRSHFEPQVALFSEALQAFCRPHRAEAERMDEEYELPFPQIH